MSMSYYFITRCNQTKIFSRLYGQKCYPPRWGLLDGGLSLKNFKLRTILSYKTKPCKGGTPNVSFVNVCLKLVIINFSLVRLRIKFGPYVMVGLTLIVFSLWMLLVIWDNMWGWWVRKKRKKTMQVIWLTMVWNI